MTRVKLTVDHLREDFVAYLEAEGATTALLVAEKTTEALAAFDFDEAIARIAHTELTRFVEQATRTYFKGILESKDAHSVVIDALQAQIGMNS